MQENPRQRIAPAKNAENTAFSCQLTSTDGLVKKYAATITNATHPKHTKTHHIKREQNYSSVGKSSMHTCIMYWLYLNWVF